MTEKTKDRDTPGSEIKKKPVGDVSDQARKGGQEERQKYEGGLPDQGQKTEET